MVSLGFSFRAKWQKEQFCMNKRLPILCCSFRGAGEEAWMHLTPEMRGEAPSDADQVEGEEPTQRS